MLKNNREVLLAIPVVKPTLAELNKCIARYSELERCTKGIPDMELPECQRTFLNVLGFSKTVSSGSESSSPFGDQAKPAISHLKAGFGISFISVRPGKGVLMHTHDSLECFLVLSGKFKIEYELDVGNHYTILDTLDFIACPTGLERRFECLEAAAGQEEGLMLGIVSGDSPAAVASLGSVQRMVDAGLFTKEQAGTMIKNIGTGVW